MTEATTPEQRDPKQSFYGDDAAAALASAASTSVARNVRKYSMYGPTSQPVDTSGRAMSRSNSLPGFNHGFFQPPKFHCVVFDLRQPYGWITTGQDMRVVGVQPGTQAEAAGVQVGWTICRYVRTGRLTRTNLQP